MPIGEPKPIQVRIDGQNIKSFLDDRFIGMLNKEFGDIRFQHICFYTYKGEDKDEYVSLVHNTPEDEGSNKLVIDTEKPETLNKLYELLKKFEEGE